MNNENDLPKNWIDIMTDDEEFRLAPAVVKVIAEKAAKEFRPDAEAKNGLHAETGQKFKPWLRAQLEKYPYYLVGMQGTPPAPATDYDEDGDGPQTKNPWHPRFRGTPEQRKARMLEIIRMPKGTDIAASMAKAARVSISGLPLRK